MGLRRCHARQGGRKEKKKKGVRVEAAMIKPRLLPSDYAASSLSVYSHLAADATGVSNGLKHYNLEHRPQNLTTAQSPPRPENECHHNYQHN